MINFLSSTNEHSCDEGTKRLNAQELQKIVVNRNWC